MTVHTRTRRNAMPTRTHTTDPIERTPVDNPNRARGFLDPYRADNCTGYSVEDMQRLNEEFVVRWNAGDWADLTDSEAQSRFTHEVAQR